ncbi:hypothetical protein G8A07_04145 [Roseateles sp. DAIF2]|uniref:hypothetical protein n=1 Tax=Roseateles sp. DAIF2 TaxID=2714952 RepID=UPI0018A28D0A|nr:hypothetical protein [Roseateles sp. DAIF2]QPF72199.1 hypothetical protein G8A07_04145 [Roseateles sp. DAIF2]
MDSAEQQGRVALLRPASGGPALVLEDGSHVLAEQLDGQVLAPGQLLRGRMTAFGVEDWFDAASGARVPVFVQAWGLSLEAVRGELG